MTIRSVDTGHAIVEMNAGFRNIKTCTEEQFAIFEQLHLQRCGAGLGQSAMNEHASRPHLPEIYLHGFEAIRNPSLASSLALPVG